jgi:hypothetical protein
MVAGPNPAEGSTFPQKQHDLDFSDSADRTKFRNAVTVSRNTKVPFLEQLHFFPKFPNL